MRTLITVACVASLTACAVVPPPAWTFDPTQPAARRAVPAQEFAALSDRVAQLQIQRAEIRGRIAGQRDVGQRQRAEADLHRIGMVLSPLERQLATIAPAR